LPRTVAAHPLLQVLQPSDGGVVQQVRWLSLGLHERGWRVDVVAPPSCSALPELEAAGIEVHRMPLARSPAPRDVGDVRALRALADRRGYALVHAHSSKAGALARVALGRRRPVLYTPHCFAFASRDFPAPLRLGYRLAEQLLVPRSAAIVAVSEWEAELARRSLRGVRSRVEAIPNGVPSPEPPPRAADLAEFAAGAPLALFASKLRPQKDPLALVRAAAALRERGELPGRVAIVGDGELEEDVRREIAERAIEGDVRWFPFRGDPGPYLAAADLFAVPSRWESLPIAALEAMAAGLPVLASDVGGVPEIVEDGVTGRLVPAGDGEALAGTLRELLADGSARERMGAAGRRVATERFRLDAMIERTELLYERLLS
jgi:glycosyltransferase involved in cell wall biosynthesis